MNFGSRLGYGHNQKLPLAHCEKVQASVFDGLMSVLKLGNQKQMRLTRTRRIILSELQVDQTKALVCLAESPLVWWEKE